MNPEVAKRLRLLASAVSVLVLVAVLAGGWIYWKVRRSRPQLDGRVTVAGLSGPVTVARDALGVPTIRGATRLDVARSLGWLHGQERFFQIDILRRVAAGELAEVFGKRALVRDQPIRMHGFRKLAQAVLTRLAPDQRALIEAYASGVNAGLGALADRPFEYLALRQAPRPWLPEDTILVIYAMTLDLQDERGDYERTLMTLRDQFGLEGLSFFAPVSTPDDAALDGTTAPLAPIPGPKIINLRDKKLGSARPQHERAPRLAQPRAPSWAGWRLDAQPIDALAAAFPFAARDPEMSVGSNAFALAGAHTASGAAMLANDMHLDHGVPNIWYRASIEYAGRKITGVTLPGTPALVAGSNGSVAWGFTNSYVDVGDLVIVETNSIAPTLYRIPDREEAVSMERRKETFRVKGDDDVVVEYDWTIWGPIVGTNDRGRPLAHRLVAHDPDAINLHLLELEGARTTAEAIAIAHRAGMPAQNILIADQAGEIAWTIAGRLPKRIGYDGRLPVTWAFGDRRWDGYLGPDETPTILGRASAVPGRIWSANNRHVGGDALAKLGDGALRRAPRAAQIRDDLAALAQAAPRDLLAVQLDDRAPFLKRWHALLMEVLSPPVVAAQKSRASLRTAAEKWEGRASVDAVSYRLVKEFRRAVYDRVFTPIFAPCHEAFPAFSQSELQLEGAVWAMLREKPLHLLNPDFTTWDDLLAAAVDDTIKGVEKAGVTLDHATWGQRNVARIRHPFSHSFPWLGRWLNMPADPLPGDADMPRVQSPTHGSSERLVVSPGREAEGLFHMPGGQSAHPMSPYYRAGHEAWVRGEPTPFLPGKTEHTLTLAP